jgi:hypothetical protein
LLAKPVELRVAVEHAGRDELVEDADDKRREDRKDDVVQRERPRLVGDLARKVVEERVLTRQVDVKKREVSGSRLRMRSEGRPMTHVELRHVKDDVLVERVEDQFGQPLVTPRAVDEQQLLQVLELRDGDVGRPRRLETFDARDADANVRCLNHGHVVGAVADGKQDRFGIVLDELDNERLLQRRDSAADDGLSRRIAMASASATAARPLLSFKD